MLCKINHRTLKKKIKGKIDKRNSNCWTYNHILMWLGKLVTGRKAMINLKICSFKISPADFGSSKNLSGSCKPKDDMFDIK